MSKQRFDIRLKNEQGNECFVIDGSEERHNSEELIQLLRNGIRTETIKAGTIKKDRAFTKYIFDVESFDEKTEEHQNGKIVVRVMNIEKSQLPSLDKIEDMCNVCVKTKKVNFYRIVAGVLVTVTLATLAGPTIAKGLEKLLQKEDDYNNAQAQSTIQMMQDYVNKQRQEEEHKKQLYEEAQQEREMIEEVQKSWTK